MAIYSEIIILWHRLLFLWGFQGKRKPCNRDGSRKPGGAWPATEMQKKHCPDKEYHTPYGSAKAYGPGFKFWLSSETENEEQTFCFYYPKNGPNNNNRERHTVKING